MKPCVSCLQRSSERLAISKGSIMRTAKQCFWVIIKIRQISGSTPRGMIFLWCRLSLLLMLISIHRYLLYNVFCHHDWIKFCESKREDTKTVAIFSATDYREHINCSVFFVSWLALAEYNNFKKLKAKAKLSRIIFISYRDSGRRY